MTFLIANWVVKQVVIATNYPIYVTQRSHLAGIADSKLEGNGIPWSTGSVSIFGSLEAIMKHGHAELALGPPKSDCEMSLLKKVKMLFCAGMSCTLRLVADYTQAQGPSINVLDIGLYHGQSKNKIYASPGFRSRSKNQAGSQGLCQKPITVLL